MTEVIEGIAATHPPCPACPSQPCVQSSPYSFFSQDVGKQHEGKVGGDSLSK